MYGSNHAFISTAGYYSTTSELTAANGYVQGGSNLNNLTLSGSSGLIWTGSDNVWTATGAGFTAYYGVIYDVTVNSSLVACFDFAVGKSASNNGTFKITWNTTSGILKLE